MLWHDPAMSHPVFLPRVRVARQRHITLVAVVAFLAMVLGNVPGWTLHQHTVSGDQHGHDHAHDHDHHHHPASVPEAADEAPLLADDIEPSGLHGHALPTVSLSVALSCPLVSGAPMLPTPEFPPARQMKPACNWPPPYRPPIA